MQFKLKALTPIWTGGIKGGNGTQLVHLTGLKGSIRGLGGYACDPNSANAEDRCSLDPKKLDKNAELDSQVEKLICPVCRFFGCTGWASKFILRIEFGNFLMAKAICDMVIYHSCCLHVCITDG